jgi:hypothetical protein
MSKVVFAALAKNPGLIEDVRTILGKSMAEAKDHDRWLVLWSLIICPRVFPSFFNTSHFFKTPENQLFCSLLNVLVQQIFYETDTTMDIVVQPLISRNIGRKEVMKLIADKCIFLVTLPLIARHVGSICSYTSISTCSTPRNRFHSNHD